MKSQSLLRSISMQALLVNSVLFSLAFGQNVLLNPTGSQVITQPAGTSLNVNTLEQVRSSDQFQWSQLPSMPATLTGGSLATVTLSSCPRGIDISGNSLLGGNQGGYQVYLSGGGNSEAVFITGGSTASCLASMTVQF